MTARRGRTTGAALAGLAISFVLGACASLPTGGAVRSGERGRDATEVAPFDFNPPSPRPGASREQVVAGFLTALQATPVSTKVASAYLSEKAQETWEPGRRTIVYGGLDVVATGGEVSVLVRDAFELDEVGRWAGPAGSRGQLTLRLGLTLENGEWRLARPVDALLLPQTHFESRYREYSLYFFDRTGSVLVPEPVYLPWGVQAPTLLVRGLLQGPRRPGADVARTYFPTGTRLGVSVPVSGGGVAEVPLTEEFSGVEGEDRDRALAQLGWTLRQIDTVESVRLAVAGDPLDVTSERDVVDVDDFQRYDPALSTASGDLYGVRGDEVRQVVGETELIVATVPGAGANLTPARSLAISTDGRRFAVVERRTSRVLLLERTEAEVPGTVVYDGVDVLRPSWDLTGRLWLVDRTGEGGRVLVASEGRLSVLDAPGLSGADVLAMTVSRDGTRLAAVTARAGGTRLTVLRVARRTDGAPVRLVPEVSVEGDETWGRVRALGWRDPTTLAALVTPRPGVSQVYLIGVDGSSAFDVRTGRLEILFEPAAHLAASPGGPMSLVVGTAEGLVHRLDPQGRWEREVVEAGLRLPAYVG